MKNVVVICTYNEAENIAQILDKLLDYQVVLVDDNSPDGTANIASSYSNVHVIKRRGKLGIASAYHLGFKEALKYNSKYIVQMDAGLTHNPTTVGTMIDMAELVNSPLVIGSRFDERVELKGFRTLISLGAKLLMDFIHVHVSDVTSGFRCWRSDLLKRILGTQFISKGFAFQLETLFFAHKFKKEDENIITISIPYKLTNSSFKLGMVLEALMVYLVLLFW